MEWLGFLARRCAALPLFGDFTATYVMYVCMYVRTVYAYIRILKSRMYVCMYTLCVHAVHTCICPVCTIKSTVCTYAHMHICTYVRKYVCTYAIVIV